MQCARYPVLLCTLWTPKSKSYKHSIGEAIREQIQTFSDLNGALVVTIHKKKTNKKRNFCAFISQCFTFLRTTKLKISVVHTPIICRNTIQCRTWSSTHRFLREIMAMMMAAITRLAAVIQDTVMAAIFDMWSAQMKVGIYVMATYNRRLAWMVNVTSSKQLLGYRIHEWLLSSFYVPLLRTESDRTYATCNITAITNRILAYILVI